MPQLPIRYGLYTLLYTLTWLVAAGLAYRLFFSEWTLLRPELYLFFAGIWFLLCCAVRSLRTEPAARRLDPVIHSLGIAGLTLLLFANVL